MRQLLSAMYLGLVATPALAGGFVCDMSYECRGNMGCEEVSYQPYLDTGWGQVAMKSYGPEIALKAIPGDGGANALKLFGHLPGDGLFIVAINEDSSAVFTSYLRQGGSAQVLSVCGSCESRG